MLRGVRDQALVLHCVAQYDHNPEQIYGDSEADLKPEIAACDLSYTRYLRSFRRVKD
jgi:hypothetical protein